MKFKNRIIIAIFLVTLSMLGVSASGKIKPEVFGNLPAVYDAAISSDGNQIALITNRKGVYGVSIFSGKEFNEEKKVPALSRGIHPIWIKWVGNDHVLLGVRVNRFKGKLPIVFEYILNINVVNMESSILFGDMRYRRQFNAEVLNFLENDPEHILMSILNFSKYSGMEQNPEVRKVSVYSGKFARVKKDTKDVQNWIVDRSGQPRVGQGIIRKTSKKKNVRAHMEVRDTHGDKWRNVDDYPGLNSNSLVFGFTSNPNEMIVGQYREFDTLGLYIYNLKTKAYTRKLYHNERYDVSGLIYDSQGNDIIGVEYVTDTRIRVLFSGVDKNIEFLSQKYPNLNIDYIDSSRDGNSSLYKVSGVSNSGFFVFLNSSRGQSIRLSDTYSGLIKEELGKVGAITYKARDGFEIPGYITMPPLLSGMENLKDAPFIVLPHGGPYARDSKRFDYFAQFFATRGYGVLQMNFRGSSGYGKKFEDAGRGNWVVMQEDVEDGTRWLIEQGFADPSRICIAGWSYGGYAALMGAINNPDMYKCAVSMAGVTDLQDMIMDIRRYEFGHLSAKNSILRGFENKDAIKRNSPVKRANEIRIPLFLAHGTVDQRVHFDQFTRMEKALRKSPAKVTYMSFKNEDHFLSDQENRQQFFVGLDKFLADNLGEGMAAP